MPNRVMDRPLPAVQIVDMRRELELGNRSIFSTALQEKLGKCIRSGQQAMLFVNRRGYAPFVTCRACGQTIKCAQCDVTMAYHRSDERLHCHYCGASMPLPERCPSCGSASIRAVGIGTQRVEEEVKKLFPSVQVIRMDMDTTKTRNAHYELLNAFRARRAQVLVGTQMIAKGLDFPQVTLVGAVLADLTLNMPDYRAPERTFQLLVQVAGRAGRAQIPGEVVIQTYKPDHYAITAAAAQDYRAYFEQEFSRRKMDLYPPFTLIARFLCEAPDAQKALDTATRLMNEATAWLNERPMLKKRLLFIRADEAPISYIQERYRAHVLLKLLNHKDSEEILSAYQLLAQQPQPSGVRVCFEINPASLA
jgi:primosomal protein N' (replication factor Y)